MQDYKKRGGGYLGKKSDDNSLKRWTDEDWGTKSGRDSRETGERYLPKKARKSLSNEEYRKTSAKKRADTLKGKQFSAQPQGAAKKTSQHRPTGGSASKTKHPTRTKHELLSQARRLGIQGRSHMLKSELEKAIRLAEH